ncbi:hypothetical protein D9M72_549450 [compost metagenome]
MIQTIKLNLAHLFEQEVNKRVSLQPVEPVLCDVRGHIPTPDGELNAGVVRSVCVPPCPVHHDTMHFTIMEAGPVSEHFQNGTVVLYECVGVNGRIHGHSIR